MNNGLLNTIDQNTSLLDNWDSYAIDGRKIISAFKKIRVLLFPDYFESEYSREELLHEAFKQLDKETAKIVSNHEELIKEFFNRIPDIQRVLYTDVEAIYNGDPSSKTYTEIIYAFPGFIAVFLYRLAHELYELNVPIIPRVITEYAHEKTGIDINPGAKIGEYFCIDHGTGIVVGETAVIGNHVRMYHGVTLGVRNFRKDENGNLLKGGKRHPNIGNHVILYANCTILGGDTYIADNSVIPAGSLILQTPETFR